MNFDEYDCDMVSVSEDGSRFVVRMSQMLKCFDSETLEEIEELPLESSDTLFAMAENHCAVISEEDEELQVFDFATAKEEKSIPINSAFVYTLCMDETEKLIFVTYHDKTVEVYDRETLELKKTFTEFEDEILLCKNSVERNLYFLYGISEAYVCNADSLESEMPANVEDIEGVPLSVAEKKISIVEQQEMITKKALDEIAGEYLSIASEDDKVEDSAEED